MLTFKNVYIALDYVRLINIEKLTTEIDFEEMYYEIKFSTTVVKIIQCTYKYIY